MSDPVRPTPLLWTERQVAREPITVVYLRQDLRNAARLIDALAGEIQRNQADADRVYAEGTRLNSMALEARGEVARLQGLVDDLPEAQP